jgi:hypothetical protein
MLVAMIAAALLMADASTAAPTDSSSPPTAASQPAKKKTDDQQVVCKSEMVIGSRLPVKKCRSAAQAAADKQNAREELERAQGAMANNPH